MSVTSAVWGAIIGVSASGGRQWTISPRAGSVGDQLTAWAQRNEIMTGSLVRR
jgi:hypothetical protein